MTICSRLLFASALLCGVTTISSLCAPAPFSDYRDVGVGDLRSLVDRTQSDLRSAAGLNHGNKQTDRYHKAQDHLSKLDRSLSRGKYNKGAMNDSIDELKSILDHNTIQSSARDALMRDLRDLKVARASR